jgi:hypothetical protein
VVVSIRIGVGLSVGIRRPAGIVQVPHRDGSFECLWRAHQRILVKQTQRSVGDLEDPLVY